MAKLMDERESRHYEHESIAIRTHGDETLIDDQWFSEHSFPTELVAYYHLKAFRLDAICTDERFALLLAGLRVEAIVGEKPQGTSTFTHAVFGPQRAVEAYRPVDVHSRMQHAIVGPLGKDIIVARGQHFAVKLTYTGPQLNVRFLRVIDLGLLVRAIA